MEHYIAWGPFLAQDPVRPYRVHIRESSVPGRAPAEPQVSHHVNKKQMFAFALNF